MLTAPRQPQPDKGFTIVEMAIVLLIVGLLAGIILPLTGTMQARQNRSETSNKLAALDQALQAYVATHRRLPCPADGALASGAANAGVAQPNGPGDCTVQIRGVVPWATLGLGEGHALDAWGVRITYRVPTLATGFTRANALDATRCDPAGAAPRVPGAGAAADACAIAGCNAANVAACTSPLNFVTNRGLFVFDEANTQINNPAAGTGAAYILISHGAFGGGGYNNSGGATIGSAIPAGTNENLNRNNLAINLAAPGYFHGSQEIEAANNTHFDDLVSHPTVMSLLIKAQLGPRAQP